MIMNSKDRIGIFLESQDWKSHRTSFDQLASALEGKGHSVDTVIERLKKLNIAIPSWALGRGGTRFGRFSMGGEPRSLTEKLDDIGVLHQLTGIAGSVSLHIPWDIPSDYTAIAEVAQKHHLFFDAVNSNTFQDQENDQHSYLFGSLASLGESARQQAVAHNKAVIEIGKKLGSKALTVWLADGSNFPGQSDFVGQFSALENSLEDIYGILPDDWKMLIEYKPYEPNFYHTVIQDWGSSFMLAHQLGDKAKTLVDLGHHLPNSNIEQIVAILMHKGKLGGFHFNDSKYGDDDLTVGSIKPYTLFLIFCELVKGETRGAITPDYMIDASHNVKDPLVDLLQSLENIVIAYAKALLVPFDRLFELQKKGAVEECQEVLQDAFLTDVRPLVQEARRQNNCAHNPVEAYRQLNIRKHLISIRGTKTISTGL